MRTLGVVTSVALLLGAGCLPQTNATRNAFLTLTETFGSSLFESPEEQQSGGAGSEVETNEFRASMTLTLTNLSDDSDLNVKFAAWVKVNSLRDVEQEEALFRAGFVQLTEDVQLGSTILLPAGTFVYDGGGIAGSTQVFIPAAAAAAAEGQATTGRSDAFDLVTPDAILVFYEPPVSCESVAFVYTQNGLPVEDSRVAAVGNIFGGASSNGGLKTLAQVDAYQCQPFKPGLYLNQAGGSLMPNEYFEGDNITIEFRRIPTDNGIAATVEIGG